MDLVSVILRFRGVDILYLQSYYLSKVGLGVENIKRLKATSRMILSFGLPFVLAADFNMRPEQLARSNFLSLVHGVIIQPSGDRGEPMSATSIGGNLIDYIVGSATLAPAISPVTICSSSWKTHPALQFLLALYVPSCSASRL